MKVLLVGLAKSGTTALYFKLKQALPETTWCLFEPPRFEPSEQSGTPNVLAKILIGAPGDFDYPSFRDFEKRILMVRDPRDHLISRLLYRACADPAFRNDDLKVQRFVEALREKERNPRNVSLLELYLRYNSISDPTISWPQSLPAHASGELPPRIPVHAYSRALEFHEGKRDLFTYRYEDFVSGNYHALECNLRLTLAPGDVAVAGQYEHVTRTKQFGDWRHWFTRSDVDFFRPYLLSYMRAYGYADEWSLADRPTIATEHASKFVLRSVAQRRRIATGAAV